MKNKVLKDFIDKKETEYLYKLRRDYQAEVGYYFNVLCHTRETLEYIEDLIREKERDD